MSEKTILLVEDDYLNRRLTRRVLDELGYQVVEAKNAKNALETLANNKIDLVILDINLGEGEMDGIDLSRQIQDRFHIPFIYLSAYENKHFLSRANAISPSTYLTKPFKNSDLIAALETALHLD
ncbi:response regulator [Jiulongibacter sediminis]|jgi:CheY-like chemotaxis protein|uniref:response regulator n=1 Tax=Jiulongibacter sediminis TaxID=1605367 RepID=UPI0026EE2665|nr:response regulator [Jiulongibacter sediminis]